MNIVINDKKCGESIENSFILIFKLIHVQAIVIICVGEFGGGNRVFFFDRVGMVGCRVKSV